ncbi:MAG TPA: hypothetical protein VNS22_11245 [Geminicoccus sp.]|uniref:hypothetical protein n=1 Tax=Geminicoccus sp. TaxID=2024832 RepID=UPI002C440714|nr:hypothetical protein [Geminicoccus sp.]HWL68947.1 hypothetical protein [Geminicoccus sp.]
MHDGHASASSLTHEERAFLLRHLSSALPAGDHLWRDGAHDCRLGSKALAFPG